MTYARGSILLVDDEEKILKSLGRALREAGHNVVDTTSPRQAQRLLAERPFDLLVVDNMMPELSGLDLIREYVGSAPEGERAPAGLDNARPRHGQKRDRGDEAGRPRLPAQAVRDRRADRRRAAGTRPPAPAHAAPLSAQRTRRAVRSLRNHRGEAGHWGR